MSVTERTVVQFLLFSGIGMIGTAGHYLCLISLVELAGFTPTLATTLGFITGAVINYALNYRFTFNSQKRHLETLTKFMVIALIGALFNILIMFLGVSLTHLHYLIIQIVATVIVLIWNFSMNKIWTFAKGPENSL